MLKRDAAIKSQAAIVRIPGGLMPGVHFFDKVIIHKTNDFMIMMSSSCTHLGCKIRTESNNRLVCPCHGSAFDLDGSVLQGPAVRPLKKLSWKTDNTTGEYVIELS